MNKKIIETKSITRLEAISESGREFVKRLKPYEVLVLSIQDQGRTLKFFNEKRVGNENELL